MAVSLSLLLAALDALKKERFWFDVLSSNLGEFPIELISIFLTFNANISPVRSRVRI
jgi:hypothetical protein